MARQYITASILLTRESMEQKHRELLKSWRNGLVEELSSLEPLCDILLARKVFTPENKDDILVANLTQRDQARKLLDILPTRGPNAFQAFIEALRSPDLLMGHIADKLEGALTG